MQILFLCKCYLSSCYMKKYYNSPLLEYKFQEQLLASQSLVSHFDFSVDHDAVPSVFSVWVLPKNLFPFLYVILEYKIFQHNLSIISDIIKCALEIISTALDRELIPKRNLYQQQTSWWSPLSLTVALFVSLSTLFCCKH